MILINVDILPRVSVHSVTDKAVNFRYVVDVIDCNAMGTLHGGAIATLADNLTSYAAMLDDLYSRPGVSVSLDVDYMLAPKPGDEILIECICDKTGKLLSFSSAIFYNQKVSYEINTTPLLFPLGYYG